jgi:hypothetical protein
VSGHLYLYLLLVGILTALTPWAIVGVIVLLGSRAGARAAVAFVVGWFCAVAFISAVVVAAATRGNDVPSTETSTAVLIVELVLGILLVAFAARQRARNRSLPPASTEPGWLTKLDKMGPVVAFAFGTFMINVVFVVDAALRIAEEDPASTSATAAILFYTVVSTASLVAVLVVYFSDRARSEARLVAMRAWVARNNAAVIVGMLAGIGAVLTVKGAIGLLV